MGADDLPVLQMSHVLRHAFAAAGAGESGEDAGLFRKGLLGLVTVNSSSSGAVNI